MLSNTRIVEYQRSNPGQSLLADRTFFRFLLARSLGEPVLAPLEPVSASDTFVRHRVFAQYHRAGVLRGDESLSGPGSSMGQTDIIRRALPPLLGRLGVRSLLDAGCGDFNWMRQIVGVLDHYTGVDLIPELIERNRRRYQSDRREFHCRDIAETDLPRADMILCRDTLVHYSLAGAQTVLRNLQRTGSHYLLATTFPGRGTNDDIPLGGWRPLDVAAPPFSFPPPLHLIVENCTEMGGRYADKSLGVWALQELVL
ncbi:MAG: class I SAM-dependent methyltransferase [Rhodopila sp.]